MYLCVLSNFCNIIIAHLNYLFHMEKRGLLDKPMKRRHLKNNDMENISVDSGEI